MTARLRLMCVLAHPDDEAMGTGALLAKCAAEGVETAVVTATLGQRGWTGAPDENPQCAAILEACLRTYSSTGPVQRWLRSTRQAVPPTGSRRDLNPHGRQIHPAAIRSRNGWVR